ncbi:MAG TPA: NADH:flavin oxidoreductase [Ignavibacteriaceae bacterium]|nr:NADH:flavin oxidoreductase [Ignavibacteriaceae bacterium]
MKMKINPFIETKVGNLHLKNRIVRSATYEGAADRNGYPGPKYFSMYKLLAKNNVGMIITGFSFVSQTGRAMQQSQSGIDSKDKIEFFRKITKAVHKYDCPIIMQLAHSGRQTLKQETLTSPISSTTKRSIYFREKPKLISREEIDKVIEQFKNSACFAKEAGFDGVQLHAGHGYLLHQFILPETNSLANEFGIDESTGIGTKLIDVIFDKIKESCGDLFTILIKISGSHNLSDNFYSAKFDYLIKFLDTKKFDAIEISFGTMDYPLNIFRGELNTELVFQYNPIFKTKNILKRKIYTCLINKIIAPKFIGFSPMYNLHFAERAKKMTDIPIISVGGFRSKKEIEYAISNRMTDLVSLSRPFICEPDFVNKMLHADDDYKSKCKNCNKCVFMCDSGRVTTCYSNAKNLYDEKEDELCYRKIIC